MSLNTAKATVILRDLTAKFDKAARTAKPFYPRLTMRSKSNGFDEKYGMLGDVPQVREWLGNRRAKELRAATYTLTNRLWELTLNLEKDNLADDRMGFYDTLMEDTGSRAATHPDKLLFDTIVAAESAPCFDSQYFFDTDHAFGDSGTQDNDLTYDASSTSNVTVDECKAASEAAILKMLGYKDDQGEPLNAPIVDRLSDIMIVVPLPLRANMIKAYEASVNATGATNVVIDKPVIICSPYLTSGVKFYTFNLGGAIKPFIFQAREPLSRGMKGLDDLERKDVLFMTRARYAIGYGAWWTAVLTTIV